MSTLNEKGRLYFDLAFELAYFIHASKEIAFFIAEDALDELPLMLGKQQANRNPARILSGFWKGGERTRPIRQTIKLSERQMLQWLCFKHSESWERETENGGGLYSATEEDLIVRYLGYLLFQTLRRGSFYVTLAIGQLLHQFDRRETRLFYDVLTQSDAARMKDTGYIGKQRLQLLARICERFDDLIQTTRTPGGERQIVTQPATETLIQLVNECLWRFAPWDTVCMVQLGFDVTDIPGLYSADSETDEDSVEMNRIHTVVEPECFARFSAGLCKYARTLPDDNQDKGCNFDSPDYRLAVPQFLNFPNGPSRGDRNKPPLLTREDYVRLSRTLDARARRRSNFNPNLLTVYVDSLRATTFDLSQTNRADLFVGSEVGVIEVRGSDDEGELTLATLLIELDEIPPGGIFRDSLVDARGRKLGIQVAPIRNALGDIEGANLHVVYSSLRLTRWISKLAGYPQRPAASPLGNPFWLKVGLTLLLVGAAFVVVWFLLHPSQRETPAPQQAEKPPVQLHEPSKPNEPPPAIEHSTDSKKDVPLLARARWSADPKTALLAVSIEPTRGETKVIDFSRRQTQIFLSLPMYDDDRAYSRYRIKLEANDEPVWERTLRAPAKKLAGDAHILNLVLSPGRLAPKGPYTLRVEACSRTKWSVLGHVTLSPKQK